MVQITDENPFHVNRWEDEREHLFWLPPVFDALEKNRCVFLIGTRGAGKTTLLKAFDWKERIFNKSLKRQIQNVRNEGVFAKRYIGIYMDLGKQYVLDSFYLHLSSENLSSKEIEYNRGQRFSQYIEYLAAYNLTEGIDKLRTEGYICFTPEQELETVAAIFQMRPELKSFLSTNYGVLILEDVKNSLKRIYEHIWNDSVKGSTKNDRIDLPYLPIGQALGELSEALLGLCGEKDEKWIVKVCIDSIENLVAYQQKALNTLVASQKEHTTFVFASTHENIDHDSTFIPDHPLTHDDREIFNLDKYYRTNRNFEEFIAGVTKLRFEKILGDLSSEVDLKKILGDYTINELLDYEFNKTISPKFLEFREYVMGPFLNQWTLLNKTGSQIPPYTQAYVTQMLKISLEKYLENKYDFEVLSKSCYQKTKVMAMLCLLYDSKSSGRSRRIPYAGYNMIVNMSENNIRDFLRQLSQIYEMAPYKGEKFLKTVVSIDVQKIAIRSASEKKYNEIESESSYATDINNLILFLGDLTHYLHTSGIESLLCPERGIFVIDYTKIQNGIKRKYLQDIIRRASVIKYYIKVENTKVDPSSKEISLQKFHLHRLFAPYFIFSYRRPDSGPRYEISLDPNVLVEICENSEMDLERIIKKTVGKSPIIDKSQTTFADW